MLSGVEDNTVTKGNLLQVTAQFGNAAGPHDPFDQILDKDEELRRKTRAAVSGLVASSLEAASRQVAHATSMSSEFDRHVSGRASGPHAAMAAVIIGMAERHGLPEVNDVRRRLNVGSSSRFVAGRKLGGLDLN